MKLWLMSQTANSGYDTYDSAVVAAESAGAAKAIHPDGDHKWVDGRWRDGEFDSEWGAWADPDDVTAKLIGDAAEGVAGVVCASFNAG